MSRPRSADLRATIALTAISVLVALFFDSGPVAAIALLPLVLVLPGYAISAALLPPGSISRELRLALTLALSVCAAALGGVVFQVFLGLGRGAFVFLLAAETLAASAIALRGRDRSKPPAVPGPRLSRLPKWSIVAFAAALALCIASISIASSGADKQLAKDRFSALWLLPRGTPGTPPAGTPVQVGVENHEGETTAYELRVTQSGAPVREWRFALEQGEEWDAKLTYEDVARSAPIVAQLFKDGRPYRRVAVELLPAGGPANG